MRWSRGGGGANSVYVLRTGGKLVLETVSKINGVCDSTNPAVM